MHDLKEFLEFQLFELPGDRMWLPLQVSCVPPQSFKKEMWCAEKEVAIGCDRPCKVWSQVKIVSIFILSRKNIRKVLRDQTCLL